MTNLAKSYVLSDPVATALRSRRPVVALESTVITHGFRQPRNIQLAQDMESAVVKTGATPATIALLDRKIRVGLRPDQLEAIAQADNPVKVSLRDFATAMLTGRAGGATVAATSFVANQVGIQVFATGGIGGVHREPALDISTDLTALGQIPVVVVCAGAKAILDLPGTLEVLETLGVPVLGYQTSEFPAFYSRSSGLAVSHKVDSPEEVAAFARQHWELGFKTGVLVAVPAPEATALDPEDVNEAINQALAEARDADLRGQAITPFLLARIGELTGQASLDANISLLLNNAKVAAQIALELSPGQDRML
jgi:pseudouridine-5'-phosphate glycosidase